MKLSDGQECRRLFSFVFRRLFSFISMTAVLLSLQVFFSCKGREEGQAVPDEDALRQVLYVQSLYNGHPGEDIVPQIREVVDSMRHSGRNPYYFAAVNILIDRLFSDGRFAEADSLAVRMEDEAVADRDTLSMAMAKRVRAQMFYKLSQPGRAFRELEPAGSYIADPYRSRSDFGTATSVQEWLWIISRELGDTVAMNRAGMNYARMVEEYCRLNGWSDTTGHYPVSALAFRAEEAFSRRDMKRARTLLDSAGQKILPSLPSRAYEHLYAVRSLVRAADSDREGALADADTLLATHKDFPWFYLKDLLLKARILNMVGKHEESAAAYSEYVSFHDSLSERIVDNRIHDLTVLYRTEIDREQKRAQRFRLFAFGAVVAFLLVLLGLSSLQASRVRKRNRLLVGRLRELDRAAESACVGETAEETEELSPMERLDRYMTVGQPYTDPALGVKELAAFCGTGPDSLRQLVKEGKGISVRTYINSFRLEEARRVLGSGSDEGISELAVRLGFGTSRTLQRVFKERYGMSPTQYRQAAKEIETAVDH